MLTKLISQPWIILEAYALTLFQRVLAREGRAELPLRPDLSSPSPGAADEVSAKNLGPLGRGEGEGAASRNPRLAQRTGTLAAMPRRPTSDIYGEDIAQMTIQSGIAIVPIHGALVQGASGFEKWYDGVRSHEDIDEDLDAAENALQSGKARAILLDMKSPGGTVAGTPELAARISALAQALPVYSFNGSLSASAAEYLSAAAQVRFATPSSTNGSIGVILQRMTMTGWLEMWGVKVDLFTSGKLKAAQHPLKELSESDREHLQGRTDELGAEFRAHMLAHRPALQAGTMQGQVFTGTNAAKNGLVDALVPSLRAVLAAI